MDVLTRYGSSLRFKKTFVPAGAVGYWWIQIVGSRLLCAALCNFSGLCGLRSLVEGSATVFGIPLTALTGTCRPAALNYFSTQAALGLPLNYFLTQAASGLPLNYFSTQALPSVADSKGVQLIAQSLGIRNVPFPQSQFLSRMEVEV